MPVSHLGLPVSHIASSSSFYLAALQPLGYRLIGHQGGSCGFGVHDADFFICQAQAGTKVSPTHIAFAADSRVTVRSCFNAAMNAGARASGAPGYRNGQCGCFNAAVEDLDGHTIEFILRETQDADACRSVPAPSEPVYSQTRPDRTTRSVYEEDRQSVATKASHAKSRAQTALDLASATSKSLKQPSGPPPPTPGLTRSRTEPVMSDGASRNLVGALIGAAAVAAGVYAMNQSEKSNARDESEYARSMSSSNRHDRTQSGQRSTVSRSSVRSSKPSNRNRLAIEPLSYPDEDCPDVLSRYRPAPQRSRTYDAIEYAPRPTSSGRNDRYSMKRSSTLPNSQQAYYPEGPKTTSSSRHRSRRDITDFEELERHDSAVSVQSHHSRRSVNGSRVPSASQVSTVKPSKRGSAYESGANYPLPSSNAPTYPSAADRPLPPSRATSYISARQVPLPQLQMTAAYYDMAEESDGLGDIRTVVPDDSISCIDISTRSAKSRHSRGSSSRHSSKRSEANSDCTVRPAKTSGVQTLPVRSKDDYYRSRDGKRSTLSYA